MLVDILKALADDSRLRILNILLNNELCVCEIETVLDMSQSNVSRHLTRLKTSGIITGEKSSQWVYYKINESFIEANHMLYLYLCKELKKHMQCRTDSMRLDSYKESGISCEQLNREGLVKE